MHEGVAPSLLDIRCWRMMVADKAEGLPFAKMKRAKFGLAQSRGVLQHPLEDGLQRARQVRDDLQDLRGRALLLWRLSELSPHRFKDFWR